MLAHPLFSKQVAWIAFDAPMNPIARRDRDRMRHQHIRHDAFGKPHYWGEPQYISIAHTSTIEVSIIAPMRCGIDLEEPRPESLVALSRKFKLHASLAFEFWMELEALYKMSGRPMHLWLKDRQDGLFPAWPKWTLNHQTHQGCLVLEHAPEAFLISGHENSNSNLSRSAWITL